MDSHVQGSITESAENLLQAIAAHYAGIAEKLRRHALQRSVTTQVDANDVERFMSEQLTSDELALVEPVVSAYKTQQSRQAMMDFKQTFQTDMI